MVFCAPLPPACPPYCVKAWPLSKGPAPLVFVAPATISTPPVVADASMSVSEDAIFVGDVAVAAMSVTIPSPVLLLPEEEPRIHCSKPLMVTVSEHCSSPPAERAHSGRKGNPMLAILTVLPCHAMLFAFVG